MVEFEEEANIKFFYDFITTQAKFKFESFSEYANRKGNTEKELGKSYLTSKIHLFWLYFTECFL